MFTPTIFASASMSIFHAFGGLVMRGVEMPVQCGVTVKELRANQLFDWLQAHRAGFSGRRTFSFDDAQNLANQGGVALIIAQRSQRELSGHVAMIVPESPEIAAVRDSSGLVKRPVTSQSGGENFRRKAPNTW